MSKNIIENCHWGKPEPAIFDVEPRVIWGKVWNRAKVELKNE